MKKKSGAEITDASRPVRRPGFSAGGVVFEIEGRQLKALLARRAVRRRALADSQRRMLERLIKKAMTVEINEYTRERLERSIRVHEDVAEFLAFAGDHLVGLRGRRHLTASELATLDLMPRDTLY